MPRDYKAEAAYMKKVFQKVPKLPKDIDQWMRNNPLNFSKYLFCYREMGVRFGYCTHCGKVSQLDGLKRTETYDEIQNGCHMDISYKDFAARPYTCDTSGAVEIVADGVYTAKTTGEVQLVAGTANIVRLVRCLQNGYILWHIVPIGKAGQDVGIYPAGSTDKLFTVKIK